MGRQLQVYKNKYVTMMRKHTVWLKAVKSKRNKTKANKKVSRKAIRQYAQYVGDSQASSSILTIRPNQEIIYRTIDGVIHRLEGPARIRDNGEEWWVDGYKHRVDGPAVTKEDGTREWWVGGRLNRLDGPAIIEPDNRLYYIDADLLSPYDFSNCIQERIVETTEDGEYYLNFENNYSRLDDEPAVIEKDGTQEWWVFGNRHRLNGPAVINSDGTKEWWMNGVRHRSDGPAVERPDGTMEWWVQGKKHRLGGPADVLPDGTKVWWQDDQRHRLDGPAIEYPDGSKAWYIDGEMFPSEDSFRAGLLIRQNKINKMLSSQTFYPTIIIPETSSSVTRGSDGQTTYTLNGSLHRLGGPAVVFPDGTMEWWVNGSRHRLDGPAIEKADGTKEWWYEGGKITEDGLLDFITHSSITYGDDVRYTNMDDNLSRVGGPAIEGSDGSEEWYLNGIRHRLDGPAVTNSDGTKEWWVEGIRHRVGAPAIESNGTSQIWMDGNQIISDTPNLCIQNLSNIRNQLPTNGKEDCDAVFTVKDKLKDRMYSIGAELENLIEECNRVENGDVNSEYILNIVKYLRLNFPLMEDVVIKTKTNHEIADALKFKDRFGMYIKQATSRHGDSSARLDITYSDQPGIDYGGVSRQFISNVMEKISSTLFSEIPLEQDPYIPSYQRGKNTQLSSKPRNYISNKSDDKIRNELNLSPAQKITDVYEFTGSMFAYAAINQIQFDIPLSRMLLKKMLEGPDTDSNDEIISANEAVSCYILDTGKALDKSLAFIRDDMSPDMIDTFVMDIEDTLKGEASKTYRVNKRLLSFLDGFRHVGTALYEAKITVNELNAMLYTEEISRENMMMLLDRVKFDNMTIDQVRILKNAIIDLPSVNTNISGVYNKLLRWWTGIPVIINSEVYKIRGRDGSGINYQFFAHTCFFEFEVNKDFIDKPQFIHNLFEEMSLTRTTNT